MPKKMKPTKPPKSSQSGSNTTRAAEERGYSDEKLSFFEVILRGYIELLTGLSAEQRSDMEAIKDFTVKVLLKLECPDLAQKFRDSLNARMKSDHETYQMYMSHLQVIESEIGNVQFILNVLPTQCVTRQNDRIESIIDDLYTRYLAADTLVPGTQCTFVQGIGTCSASLGIKLSVMYIEYAPHMIEYIERLKLLRMTEERRTAYLTEVNVYDSRIYHKDTWDDHWIAKLLASQFIRGRIINATSDDESKNLKRIALYVSDKMLESITDAECRETSNRRHPNAAQAEGEFTDRRIPCLVYILARADKYLRDMIDDENKIMAEIGNDAQQRKDRQGRVKALQAALREIGDTTKLVPGASEEAMDKHINWIVNEMYFNQLTFDELSKRLSRQNISERVRIETQFLVDIMDNSVGIACAILEYAERMKVLQMKPRRRIAYLLNQFSFHSMDKEGIDLEHGDNQKMAVVRFLQDRKGTDEQRPTNDAVARSIFSAVKDPELLGTELQIDRNELANLREQIANSDQRLAHLELKIESVHIDEETGNPQLDGEFKMVRTDGISLQRMLSELQNRTQMTGAPAEAECFTGAPAEAECFTGAPAEAEWSLVSSPETQPAPAEGTQVDYIDTDAGSYGVMPAPIHGPPRQ